MAVAPFKSSDNFNMAGFNEKITEADNTYVAKTGGSMTGALSMGGNKITDVASPVNDGDAVNKSYVDRNKVQKTFTILQKTAVNQKDYTLTLNDLDSFSCIQISLLNINSAANSNGFYLYFGNTTFFEFSSRNAKGAIVYIVKVPGQDNFIVTGFGVGNTGEFFNVKTSSTISLTSLKTNGILFRVFAGTLGSNDLLSANAVVI